MTTTSESSALGATVNHNRQYSPDAGRPTIAYFAPSIHLNSQAQWLGVVDAARAYDVNLLCVPGWCLNFAGGTRRQTQANILYDLITTENVAGIISWASSIGNYATLDELNAFHARYHPLPVVTIGQKLDGYPALLMDSYQGMCEAVTHLIQGHGYRRIAFMRGPEGHFYAQERYRAYCDTLQAFDLPIDPNLITPPGAWGPDTARVSMTHLLDTLQLRPGTDIDAIVAANDGLALAAMEIIEGRGYRVPEDIAMTGFDDSMYAQIHTSPLTSVAVPYYETGYQAVETLLALLKGDAVPEEISVPSRLVVRQSCGCLDQMVVQMTINATEPAAQGFRISLEQTRPQILTDMRHALRNPPQNLLPDWDARLVDAFVASLQNASAEGFLRSLDAVLRPTISISGDVWSWQPVMLAVQRRMLPCFGMQDALLKHRAENLWRQANLMIGEAMQRVYRRRQGSGDLNMRTLREIGQYLLITFDVRELMAVLANGLPRLQIPHCYVALYHDPQPYTYPQAAPRWSRLFLAYEHGSPYPKGCRELPVEGVAFQSHHLLPDGMWPRDRQINLVMEPLYFQDTQIGFVLCEIGPRDGDVYDVLRGELSSALQGALLVQRVQQDAHELAAAYEEIRILNNELKEENVRMGVELNVARKLQQMILPRPEELRGLEGLDIVGYMEPADEVGGDYYDILHEHGVLHIGIGDVTGHGLESGVIMLMTQAAVRTLIEHGETDPVKFVNTLNRLIYKNMTRIGADKNLTFALVQYQQGQLKIVGQHEEVLVVRQGGQVERVDTVPLGFHVGLVDDISQWVKAAAITLQPGDGLVLYTDGIPEAANPANQLYGVERLCEVVSQHWHGAADAVKQAVVDDVKRHIGTQKVYDDITLVVLKQQ